jgi:translation initiation factor 2B subunit (eIF-2B alpha/beta/delta family)
MTDPLTVGDASASAEDGWIGRLPPAVAEHVRAFADPHPPGARARAQLAGRAIVELVAGWADDPAALRVAVEDLVAGLNSVGQGTVHQPGVRNMIGFVLAGGLDGTPSDVANRLRAAYEEASRTMAEASETMAEAGAGLLADGDRVLVHDFADRSTQAVVRRAAEQGKRLTVIATACRSRRADGIRVARESRAVGHDAIVVTDAGVAWAVGSLGLRVAFIGADALLPDGSTLTTPGALAAALSGLEYGVPVYAVTDLWKIMREVSPQLRDVNELEDPDGVPEALEWKAAGYAFRNPLVDIVPGRLLTGLVTEAGIIDPATAGDAARMRYGLTGETPSAIGGPTT